MARTGRRYLGIIGKNIREESQHTYEIDHISQLPLDVILLIFSFLPFKYWILMSLVSKHFKYLWTYVPDIDFVMPRNPNKESLFCPCCGRYHCVDAPKRTVHFAGLGIPRKCYRNCVETPRIRFTQFVNRAIRLHSGFTIKAFRLSLNYYHHSWNVSMIDKWVEFALTRNIEKLDLNFDGNENFKYYNTRGLRVRWRSPISLYAFPSQPFAPKVLTTMTLHFCHFKASTLGTFESLKYLYLINVDLFDNTITKMLSKFPVLENLLLEKCTFGEWFLVSEEELTIKYLCIMNCMTSTELIFPVVITAPSLMDFSFEGVYLMDFSIRKATKLLFVQIDINFSFPFAEESQGIFLSSLLNCLDHCPNLVLVSWCIQVLSTWQPSPWEYLLHLRSITNLMLDVYVIKNEFPGIYCLLRSCANLEALTINIQMVDEAKSLIWAGFNTDIFNFEENQYWEVQDLPVECLRYSLKKITIYGFTGRATEVEILKFLLKKAMILETLYIHNSGNDQDSLVSNEDWVSHVVDIYKSRIAKAIPIALSSLQVIIE